MGLCGVGDERVWAKVDSSLGCLWFGLGFLLPLWDSKILDEKCGFCSGE